MNKIRILIITMTIALTSFSFGQTESLQDLINRAITLSPKIKMLEAKKKAAYNRIAINTNIPDPVLTLGLVNMPTNSFSFTQEPMTQKVVGLSQTFPFPGSLSSIEEANSIDTLIINQEIKEATNEIKMYVKQKYYELGYLRKDISLNEESLNLLKKISHVVATKYTVSTASQQNILKVQLQITDLTEKINELKSKEQSILADLNALLLKNSNSETVSIEITEINYLHFENGELDSLSIKNRPLLNSIKYAEKKSELSQIAAQKKFYPNLNLQVQYGFRDKIAATNTPLNDFLSVMVGVTLPFNYGGKYSAAVDEQISMQEYYSEQYALAVQNLNGRFGAIVSQLSSLEVRTKLFEEGLITQAKQNFNSALASYQVNEVDFINVIDAQDQLLKVESNLFRLKTDYVKLVAEIEFLTGTEFYKEILK